jgi:hypothetical protein
MKHRGILLGSLLILLFALTACSPRPTWQAAMELAPVFTKDQPSTIAFKITDEAGQPVNNLQIKALFEMTKMDHGSIEADLQHSHDGLYQTKLNLNMSGLWQATLTMSDGISSTEETLSFETKELPSEQAIATINGRRIIHEDIAFYELINLIQIEMYREHDQKKYQGKEIEQAMKYWDMQVEAAKQTNTLLTQIIRLHAVSLLAQEKGHQATAVEVADAMAKIKPEYEQSPAAMKLIDQYGSEKFWSKQESQYHRIVLSMKVQEDVMELVKKSNPDSDPKQLQVLAQKKYEELLVSQMGTLDIKIF